jgi:chromosome segregation ATPase
LHKSHEHIDIRKEAEERRRLLLAEAKEMKQSMRSIQQQLSKLEKAVDEWNSNQEKLDDLISNDAKEKVARLEQAKRILNEQLQDLHQKGLDQLSNLQEALQRQQKYLECFKQLQETVANNGSDCEIIHFSGSLPIGQLKWPSGLPEAQRPQYMEFSATDLGSFLPRDLDLLGRIVLEAGKENENSVLTWERLREQLADSERIIHEKSEQILQNIDQIRLLTKDRETTDDLRKKLIETDSERRTAVERLSDCDKKLANFKKNQEATITKLNEITHQLTDSNKKCQRSEQEVHALRQELLQQKQVYQSLQDSYDHQTTRLNDANQQTAKLQQSIQDLQSQLRHKNTIETKLTLKLQQIQLAYKDTCQNLCSAKDELIATQQKNEERVVWLQQQLDQLLNELLSPDAGNKSFSQDCCVACDSHHHFTYT